MLYAVLLLVLVLILLGIHYLILKFGFQKLDYSLAFSATEVTEGDTVTLTETVCSRKFLPLPWLKAELTTASALVFAEAFSSVSEDTRFISSFYFLPPYRKIERKWQVKCTQRGIFTVSHAILVISDLLGISEQSKAFPNAEASITVLPRPLDAHTLPPLPAICMTGETILQRHFFPDRFAVDGVRPYQDGDNVRDICHIASARTETPMVYRFSDTAEPSLTVLLHLNTRDTDVERVSNHKTYEQAIRICCTYLCAASAQRIPVRLLANTRINDSAVLTPLAFGESHCLSLRRLLASFSDTIDERIENTTLRAISDGVTSNLLLITALPTESLLRLAANEPRLTILPIKPCSIPHHLSNVLPVFAAESKENPT